MGKYNLFPLLKEHNPKINYNVIGKLVMDYENAKSDCAKRLMHATNFSYTYEARVVTHSDMKAKKLEKWIKMAHDKVSSSSQLA
jgi:hypothetical protein